MLKRMLRRPKKPVHLLPIVRRYIKNLDRDIAEMGLQLGVLNMFKKSKTKLIIKGHNNGLQKVLEKHPVVIIANHPLEIGVLALVASLPPRKDTYLIADAILRNFVPSLDKHLIPVYLKHHHQETRGKKMQKMLTKVLFYATPTYPPEIEHQKNIASISEASKRVREGGLVVIFPGSDCGDWRRGVGYLLKEIGSLKNGYIVKSLIGGTSNLDYLRAIPLIRKLLSPISVTFSPPHPIDDVTNNRQPREITSFLQEQYRGWAKSLLQ